LSIVSGVVDDNVDVDVVVDGAVDVARHRRRER
jgi:hypothetical protein